MVTVDYESEALVLHGPGDLRLERTDYPECRPHEVWIAVMATGLCGSDVHYYSDGRNGDFELQEPIILGHEASGMILGAHGIKRKTPVDGDSEDEDVELEVGKDLKLFCGVAIEVGLPCRTCDLCARGRYNLCPELVFRSSAKTLPHAHGTLQDYIVHPASMCHRLPDRFSWESGALVEPLAVCLHAINRSVTGGSGSAGDPLAGSSALVLGAGAIGMLTAASLSVMGVTKVVVADINSERLNIVREMGDGRFNIKTVLLAQPSDFIDKKNPIKNAGSEARTIKFQADMPDGFSRVFECTGVPFCVQIGIFAAATGGKLVLIGMGTPVQTLNLGAAALREVDIIGVFRYANCYPAAIKLFASGKLDGVTEAIITHRFHLRDGEKAFRIAAGKALEGEGGDKPIVKVIVGRYKEEAELS